MSEVNPEPAPKTEWERHFDIAKRMLASQCDLCGVVHSALDGCWVKGMKQEGADDGK